MEHLATRRRLVGVIVLLLLLGGGETYAQSLSAEARDRLAPRLRSVATEEAQRAALGPLLTSLPGTDAQYGVFVNVEDRDVLKSVDVPLTLVAPGLATARVTPSKLRTLAQVGGVRRIVPARQYEPLNDVVRGVTGAHSLHTGRLGRRYTGEGVLACVIDSGIDWAHPDVRGIRDTTRSRIRALWDQTLSPRSSEQSPEALGYGVEYTRSDLEAALGGGGTSVRSVDTLGHGTQVAATIAGNGSAQSARTHRGMAPDAEIVAVKTDFSGVGIADGLRYCDAKAEAAGRPMVVNLSLGARSGPHDGSSALARTIDAVSGAGRSVVAAAGNGGDSEQHVSHSLPGNGADSLTVEVPRYSPQNGAANDVALHLDLWRSGSGTASITVITPNGRRVSLVPDSAAVVRTPDGTVAYEQARSLQGDEHVEIAAYDASSDTPPASGSWTIVMENPSSDATTMHSWLVGTTTESTLRNGNSRMTVTTPATARSALAVGAWGHRPRWRGAPEPDVSSTSDLPGGEASFSSQGPLRGGGQALDLMAPGQWTISARSQFASIPKQRRLGENDYALYRGTSAAAAATAGAAALLLQRDPSLSGSRISTLLSGDIRAGSTEEGAAQRGNGRLDVYGGMAQLMGTSVATRTQSAYSTPVPENDRTAYTLGGTGARALALRFTPQQSGVVDGLFVQAASKTANQLRDSLRVTLHADEDGRPGAQIGTAVSLAPEAVGTHAMSFASLSGSGAVVTADADYHVVLSVEEGGGTLEVAGKRSGPDGGALRRRKGEWTALRANLALQVSTSFALDLEAPHLKEPGAKAIVEASAPPTLTWGAVPNADEYTIHVSSSSEFAPARTDTFRTETRSLTLPDPSPSTGYYWRVRAERFEYSGPWSRTRSFLYYPTTVSVRVAQSFASPGRGHRLVALPGRSSRLVSRTVDGRPGADWQAYRDPGIDGLVPFDGSSAFHFRPGVGFWLRSDADWQVRTSVPSVSLTEEGMFTIPLQEGWNVISNPFDVDVSWNAVATANGGSLSPLWRFSGSFERTTTFASARRGEAFYFLNDQNLDALRLPYPAFPGTPQGRPETKQAPPGLTITAVQGTTAAEIRVGTHDNATSGRDTYDRVAPPARFTQPSLRLAPSGTERPPRQQHLAVEYRSTDADGHSFDLKLRANPNVPVTIRAAGLSAFEGQEIVLVDPTAGESYDLRAANPVTFRPEATSRSLRLLIGSSDYVETKKQVTLPSELQFLPNYPNPFDDQTTLEYVLPEPASVRLAVYDVLGRQVRVLVDDQQQAGRHTVQWNGRDESGGRMASGVYLARLVVGGTTKVRKMTFVR